MEDFRGSSSARSPYASLVDGHDVIRSVERVELSPITIRSDLQSDKLQDRRQNNERRRLDRRSGMHGMLNNNRFTVYELVFLMMSFAVMVMLVAPSIAGIIRAF